MTPPHPPIRARRTALALFVFFFGLYALTGSKLRFGYEGDTIDQAEALLTGSVAPRPQLGGILPFTQGGVMDVAGYLPFAAARLGLERTGLLFGLRQLVYVFALPFYTALLVVLFYFLALELYARPPTAAGVALILGAGTMIWPYAKFGMETWQTFWTVAGLLALVRWQKAPAMRGAAAFGLALAALMLTKITGPLNAAALAAGFGLCWLRRGLWRAPEGRRQAALAAGLALAGVGAFLLTNHWRYGGWLFAGRYGFGHETSPYPFFDGLWAVMVSPGKSLFIFSPALLVGLWFAGAFWRRIPGLRLVVILLLLIGLWHLRLRPWADETWGPRRLHYLLPVLILPVGVWIEQRHLLRRWVRLLGLGVIALGVWVQMLAVAFDYTALARALGRTDLFAIQNTVWEPQLSPLRFNLHLLESAWSRQRTGRSIPFAYELHYMPWTAPAQSPPRRVFSVAGLDRPDLWVAQQRADWAGRPYWFVSGSFYLWLACGALALAGGVALWALARREPTASGTFAPPHAGVNVCDTVSAVKEPV